MSRSHHIRSAAVLLGALLLVLAPRRADAQFGALKQKAKEKLAQAAAEKIARPDSAGAAAQAPAAAPAATPASAPTAARATASAPAAAPSKTYSDAGVLEITPQLIDGMIKGAAAASAQAQRRARPAPVTPDKPTDPFPTYVSCVDKNNVGGATDAQVEKKCGSATDAMTKQIEVQKARREADTRADSAKYGMTTDVSPDSAGALAIGVNQRQYGILRERATAFLVISAGGSKATCMRGQKEQYRFTEAESAALAARRAQLTKLFLDEDQVRMALYGNCRKA